jgi:hypothetical protein
VLTDDETMLFISRLLKLFCSFAEYANTLKSLNIADRDVRQIQVSQPRLMLQLLRHSFRIAVLFPLVLLAWIWAFPIVILSIYKGKQEMRKAKRAAPTTKDRGLDVVASKKVVVGAALTPVFYLAYVILAAVLPAILVHSSPDCVGMHIKWIVPVGVAVCLPVLIPMTLVAGDRFFESWVALSSLFVLISNRSAAKKLSETRAELQKKIREMVTRFLPELGFGSRVLEFKEADEHALREFDAEDLTL